MIYFLQFYDNCRIKIFYFYTKSMKMHLILKYKTSLRIFINKYIFNGNESNMKISVSVGLGVFSGVLPIWGFQTILAIFLAFILKVNKVILIAASNISQPPLTPFIIFVSYLVGGIILGKNLPNNFSSISVQGYVYQYLIGSIVTAVLSGVITGTISFVLLSFFRKKTLSYGRD